MKNGDKPINPLLDLNKDLTGMRGLTKREYFAGLAMQSYILQLDSCTKEYIATLAVAMADELLKQLEQ